MLWRTLTNKIVPTLIIKTNTKYKCLIISEIKIGTIVQANFNLQLIQSNKKEVVAVISMIKIINPAVMVIWFRPL